LNPGRRGGKPATNRLSYGAALGTTNTITGKEKLKTTAIRTVLEIAQWKSCSFFLPYITRKTIPMNNKTALRKAIKFIILVVIAIN
jgi:hypothetical protein